MIRSLNKPRDVNEKLFNEQNVTVATHGRYKSLYISLPSSENQEREMIKFLLWTTCSYFHLKLNAVIAYLACMRTFFRSISLAYRTDLDNCKIRSKIYDFNRLSSSASPSRC